MTIGANLTSGNLSVGGTQTSDIALGGSQTTGILNIGTSGSRTIGGRGGGINIGTAASGAIPIVIGTTGQSTTSLRGTSVNVVTKITSPTYDSTAAGTDMTVGTNLTTGSLTIGGSSSTTTINGTSVKATTKLTTPILDCVTDAGAGSTSLSIGPSAVNGNIIIGAALGVGDVAIGGAQSAGGTITLGSANTATTNAGSFTVGAGTSFRCVIMERNVGSTSSATGTITITGAPSALGNPLVFASINATTTSNPYFINVQPTGTNTFTYYKSFYNRAAANINAAIAGATSETFNYIAIWL